MKIADRTLWVLFVSAALSGVIAILVKPPDYSFYMFFPATPPSVAGRLRLVAGDTILVAGFAMSLLAAIALAWRGFKKKQPFRLLCLAVALANPYHQPIFLESLDSYVNYRWRDKAEQLGIVGKTPEEIRTLFGKPSRQWTETPRILDATGKETWRGETYTGWDYHCLPLYWMGSKFQVFFVDGKVRNFEANDD